ncbi:MAG: tRNA pseudouridine(55) synthase TruB [Ignavibacterium sp.]
MRMITKTSIDLSNINFLDGSVILFDKPLDWSSFKVIHIIRKKIGIKKIGHAGTLDPKATGLLIVCVGKETKNIFLYQNLEKTYSGTFTLGKKTPSMDSETEVLEEKPIDFISNEKILEVRDNFLGDIWQTPPMFSAINYKGKKLYKYARKGETIKLEPRKVFVNNFEINKIELPLIHFTIKCSKGTYIRVIANDFGEQLGCGAYLSSLRRINIGEYSVDEALTYDEFMKAFSEDKAN